MNCFLKIICSCRGNATRLSRLMHDELMPAKDIGAYWIEHILRHKGGKHLQLSGKDMPFYQRYLIDVFAFLTGLIISVLLVTVLLLRWIVSKCCSFHLSPKVKRKTN